MLDKNDVNNHTKTYLVGVCGGFLEDYQVIKSHGTHGAVSQYIEQQTRNEKETAHFLSYFNVDPDVRDKIGVVDLFNQQVELYDVDDNLEIYLVDGKFKMKNLFERRY